jgi:pepF/M3 family oligoendopeptidase
MMMRIILRNWERYMNSNTIPVWDLSGIFNGFSDPEYTGLFKTFGNNIKKLESMLENSKAAESLTDIIKLYNDTGAMHEELFSFAYCCYSSNTTDPAALSEINRIEASAVGFSTVKVKLRNYLSSAGSSLNSIIENSSYLSQFKFFFKEQLLLSTRQMAPELEELASDLALSGSAAWGRLQETLSSVSLALWDEKSGETKTPTELRAFAFDPDEKIRKKAWQKEIELWKSLEIPLAFALNGVKGASNTVNKRRNFASTLERSALQGRISMQTLDALIGAMKESLPFFRRYLKLKAELIGKEKIAFFDLFAPVASTVNNRSYAEATDFIVEQFTGFSDELGSFARQAIDKQWIDARPRQNKVGGAYCTGFHKSGVSRILCNFNGSLSALTTIAHELGHAYHHHILKDAPEIYRDYPMTLAETASIFCETIVIEGAMKTCGDEDRFALLEQELMESTQVIVDILSRFIFEKNVFEKRAEQELSAEDFCSMMADAQKQTFGDAMDENYMHPYMWAVKGHYYNQELGFYNFPYAFGKLFGLGLYSQYMEKGDSFAETYKKILYMTGIASAEDVTKTAGYDITSIGFWRSSICRIEEKVAEFEELCRKRKQ